MIVLQRKDKAHSFEMILIIFPNDFDHSPGIFCEIFKKHSFLPW